MKLNYIHRNNVLNTTAGVQTITCEYCGEVMTRHNSSDTAVLKIIQEANSENWRNLNDKCCCPACCEEISMRNSP